MAPLADVLFSLAGKAVIFLPVALVVQFLTDKLVGFHCQYWFAFAALLTGNLFYALLVSLLFATGVIGPHGNDPRRQLTQIALRFARLFVCQALFVLLLFRNAASERIALGKALVVGSGLVAVPVAITAFAWAFAV